MSDKIEISLSAVSAWQDMSNKNAGSAEAQAASDMVTQSLVSRLSKELSITFEDEVKHLARACVNDPATQTLLLKQVEGIASKQSIDAYRQTRAAIRGVREEEMQQDQKIRDMGLNV